MKKNKSQSPYKGITAAAKHANEAKKRQAEAFKHHRANRNKTGNRLSLSNENIITEEDTIT